MKKQLVVLVAVCLLLLSGCGFMVLPHDDDASLPEPPFEFTPKPAAVTATVNSEAEPPFEFTPKPKPTSGPTAAVTSAPTPAPTPVPTPVIVTTPCSICEGTGKCFSCGGDGILYGDEPCLQCSDGKCFMCGGTGVIVTTIDPQKTPGAGDCTICGGSGICNVCGGLGYYLYDNYGDYGKIECDPCDGTGDCPYCDGTGKE